MKLEILGCYGGRLPGKHLTSFLLDDHILVDAGAATAQLPLDRLKGIQTVLISHGHLDHVYDLCMLGDVVIGPDLKTMEIISNQATIDTLRDHLMNNRLWPDFTVLPTADNPVFSLKAHSNREVFQVGKYHVEFIAVNHPAPCSAMMFRWDGGAFLYTGDTGITDEIWTVAACEPDLKAVITEVSFPNDMLWLSNASGHYSPCQLPEELAKMGKPDVPVFLYHIKPAFEAAVRQQVLDLGDSRLRVLEQGETLQF